MKYVLFVMFCLTALTGCPKGVPVDEEGDEDTSSAGTKAEVQQIKSSLEELVTALKNDQEAEREHERQILKAFQDGNAAQAEIGNKMVQGLATLANKQPDPAAPPARFDQSPFRGSIGVTKNGIVRLDLSRIDSIDELLEDGESLKRVIEKLGLNPPSAEVKALQQKVETLEKKVDERRSTIIVNPNKEEVAPGPTIIDPSGSMGATYYRKGHQLSGGGYVYGRRPARYHDHYRSPGSNVTFLEEWEIRQRTNPISFGKHHSVAY